MKLFIVQFRTSLCITYSRFENLSCLLTYNLANLNDNFKSRIVSRNNFLSFSKAVSYISALRSLYLLSYRILNCRVSINPVFTSYIQRYTVNVFLVSALFSIEQNAMWVYRHVWIYKLSFKTFRISIDIILVVWITYSNATIINLRFKD